MSFHYLSEKMAKVKKILVKILRGCFSFTKSCTFTKNSFKNEDNRVTATKFQAVYGFTD